jgi:hypothetical protein
VVRIHSPRPLLATSCKDQEHHRLGGVHTNVHIEDSTGFKTFPPFQPAHSKAATLVARRVEQDEQQKLETAWSPQGLTRRKVIPRSVPWESVLNAERQRIRMRTARPVVSNVPKQSRLHESKPPALSLRNANCQ